MTQLTIFFDGGCPLCAAEMDHLVRLNTEAKLAFENIYARDFSQRFPQIDLAGRGSCSSRAVAVWRNDLRS